MSIFNTTNYLKLSAAVLLLFSVGLILFPMNIMRVLGIAFSPNGAMFMQFLGASLIGHAYLNWHTRGAEIQVIRPVIRMNILALLAAVLIGTAAILTGSFSVIGLMILIMHATFLGGFILVHRRIT